MKPTKTSASESVGTDEPVGLLAVQKEHAEDRLAELAKSPESAAALQKQLFGDTWATVSRAQRRAAVQDWLKGHSADRFLMLDLKAHRLA
jgi:hypothetical protein